MNEQVIKEILKTLQLDTGDISDFVIALGDLHQEVNRALSLAELVAEQQADASGLSEQDFIRDTKTSFESNFNEGGISAAAEVLSELLSDFGVSIDLHGAEPHLDEIDAFLREYGVKNFFEQKFDDSLYFDSRTTPAPSKDRALEDVKRIKSLRESEEGVEEAESLPETPENRAPAAVEDFEAEEGEFKDRSKRHYQRRGGMKPYLEKSTPEENLFRNVTTFDVFFEREDSGFNYADRLRHAKSRDDSVTAITFHPVFSSLGESATGLVEDEGKLSVSLDKMAEVKEAVSVALKQISDTMAVAQSKLEAAAREESGQKAALLEYDRTRRFQANQLDDLLAAIKKRDVFVTNLLHSDYRKKGFDVDSILKRRRYELSNNFRNADNNLTKTLSFITQMIVFLDIQKNIFHLGASSFIPNQFKERYSSRLAERFQHEFSNQLQNKIRSFFSRDSTGPWSRSSYCSYVAREIQRRSLCLLAYNKEFKIKTSHMNYSSCSVCGKNVYTRRASIATKGGGRQGGAEANDYSEYDVDVYSLFTTDGRVITEGMLNFEQDGVTKRLFAPPQDSKYLGDKSWEEISSLVSSGSKAQHVEGIARRSDALRQLNARKMSKGSVPVSSLRYKCPYGDESEKPANLAKGAKPKGATTCGLYLDPQLAIDRGRFSSNNLQTSRSWGREENPRELIEAKLDYAETSGLVNKDFKDDFLRELEKRSAGGWKFSNKFFNCPTKISIKKEHANERALKEQGYLRKYKYIASPISGPVSEGAITYSDENKLSVSENSGYYPPLGENGELYIPEEGTLTYLVCGAKTSISSFSRDELSESSLPGMINSLMKEAERNHDLSYKVQALIETLITLGVDVSDILPFLEDPSSESPDRSKLRAMETVVSDINSALSGPKPDTLAKQEEYDRFSKIARLLTVAMASPINLEKRVRGTELNRMDILGDIKLVCQHGHTFSIKDSVYFGRTHTGINIRNKSASSYNIQDIIGSGALLEEGSANFRSSLRLADRGGRRYVQVADESDLIGLDSTRKYTYDEWKGLSSNIKRLMFKGEDGLYYGFSSTPRTFIWGSEERYRLSSARERELTDRNTRVYLESSDEASIGGDKDSDGKLISFDAAASAALNAFNQSDSSGSLSPDGMVEHGPDGLITTTSSVGRLLRSFAGSINGWLTLATTLDIKSPIMGKPDAINLGDDSEESFVTVLKKNSLEAIEGVIMGVEEESLSGESAELAAKSFAYLESNFLNRLKELDKGVLHLSSSTVREFLSIGVVKSIFMSIPSVYKEESGSIMEVYKIVLLQGGALNYSELSDLPGEDLSSKSVGMLLDEIIEGLSPEAMSESEEDRILRDPMAVGKGDKWHPEGVPSKEGVSHKIAKMKGKKYMGRILAGSSALYLADVISNAYNLYMRDSESTAYIGYDIGVDLSTPEKVLSAAHNDLEKIVIGIDASYAQSLDRDELRNWYELHLDNVRSCNDQLKRSIFAVRTACTSSKYMSKAIEYITGYLAEMVDEHSEFESPEKVLRARRIIDNVMTNEPFTTVSLNSDGKYRKYFGGADAVKTESMLPIFGAPLVKFNSDATGALYPIYKLADVRGIHHSFSIDIDKSLLLGKSNSCYVLARKDLPNSLETSNTMAFTEQLPATYLASGWKVFLVKMGKGRDEYSDTEGKEKGTKQGISMIYHPSTSSIKDSEGNVLGYTNQELGLNTAETLFVGPLTMRSGMGMAFPPTPFAGATNVGVPIPIDFKGKDIVKARSKFLPVVGTRIPVDIEQEGSDIPVSVDMSDFILRDPPEEGVRILNRIEKLYDAYQQEMRLAIVDGRPSEEQMEIKDRYKGAISSLHSTYRGLPMLVESDKIATTRSGTAAGQLDTESRAARFDSRVAAYLPFADWVTIHKIISTEAFGPDWGGHQIWSADEDSDAKRRRREAIESFIIKTNNLESLAGQLALKLDEKRGLTKGTTYIDPNDLLDPVGRLFEKGLMSKKEIKDIFGYIYDPEGETYREGGLPWSFLDGSVREKALYNAGTKMEKTFPTWAKGTGSFHSIGTIPKEDSASEDPLAYIKLMNVVFPSNAVSPGEEYSPRERLERIRSLDTPDIITINDLFDFDIISGAGTDPVYYPLPDDEAGLKKYRKALKGVRHISVVRYAEALSEYLEDFVRKDLFSPLDKDLEKESITRFGLVKFSEKLNANMYFGAIVNDEGLMALWDLIKD
jgi:hypothetical protein